MFLDKLKVFLKTMVMCRVVEKEQALSVIKISEIDLNELISQKIIREQNAKIQDKVVFFFELTDKGEAMIKANYLEIKNYFYRGFDYAHDLKLSAYYVECEYKDTWKTRDDLIAEYKMPGIVDGVFVNDKGEQVAIKVFKRNSTKADLEKTEQFLMNVGIEKSYYIMG